MGDQDVVPLIEENLSVLQADFHYDLDTRDIPNCV